MQKCRFKNLKQLGKYYIAASYVKYLESAGARVVPVRLDLKRSEYEKLFKSINGILFPGGGVNIMHSDYAHVAKIFYNLAIQHFRKCLLRRITVEPLTANFHKWSLSVTNFTENEKLKTFLNVLTTNTDGKTEFISTVEARKNNHHFESKAEEKEALIYQFHPVYTGNISSFQQCYIFD
ncbi:Gamma-glutamyl hydrolase [Tupaia chinensis]|uniref:folate gamma-glutamyl hydrolase n=1 Tax=Tupaia chinensis TaxID=246437 RepID=L8Y4H0_TUPCH|nr:Gamma-glutamyl hydrolase [Tupaia chinensis]